MGHYAVRKRVRESTTKACPAVPDNWPLRTCFVGRGLTTGPQCLPWFSAHTHVKKKEAISSNHRKYFIGSLCHTPTKTLPEGCSTASHSSQSALSSQHGFTGLRMRVYKLLYKKTKALLTFRLSHLSAWRASPVCVNRATNNTARERPFLLKVHVEKKLGRRRQTLPLRY